MSFVRSAALFPLKEKHPSRRHVRCRHQDTHRRHPRLETLEARRLLTAAPTPSGLVSWWTADGTTADATSRYDATLVEGGYVPGMVGQAFDFNGIDDRVHLPDLAGLQLTKSLSVEGWISVRDFPAQGHGLILFRGDDRGGLDPYQLTTLPAGQIRFQVSSFDNGSANLTADMPANRFTHVAATLDHETGEMKLYLDGVLVQEQITSIRPFGALDATTFPGIGIGNHAGLSSSPHNFPFNGLIDELTVYERAITAEEVQAIFAAGEEGKSTMVVTQSQPAMDAIVSTARTTFAVEFLQPFDVSSLSASDLQINGIAADSVTVSEGNSSSAEFHFHNTPLVNSGFQQMQLAAGAVRSMEEGLPLSVYEIRFRYDPLPMAVVASNPPAGRPLAVTEFSNFTTAVLSSAGMRGGNGGWPVLVGEDAIGTNSLHLAIEEDQLRDDERSHTNEEVAVLALTETPATDAAPHLISGTVSGVTNQAWTTVTLDRRYDSMVVLATPQVPSSSVPLVARLRNANGSSFQVKVDRADGLESAVPEVVVHYVVVEEGVYSSAEHGVSMEAVRFDSTVTDRWDSWLGEERTYQNPAGYQQPVVFGQVMTANDPRFSVFWAHGQDRQLAPTAKTLRVGKHVGEDSSHTRAEETIGYVVMEAGQGQIGGGRYAAYVGPSIVRGTDNEAPYVYETSFATLRVELNEPVDPTTVDRRDLQLSQGTVLAAVPVEDRIIEYRLSGVPPTDVTVELVAGALTDLAGNPSTSFSANYVADRHAFVAAKLPATIPDAASLSSTIDVPDLGRVLDVNVTLSVEHTYPSDLSAMLVGPDGTAVELFANEVEDGFGLSGTTFDDQAELTLADGQPPFDADFLPRGSLGDFRGLHAAGPWSLQLADRELLDEGRLTSWSLELFTDGLPSVSNGDVNRDGTIDAADIDDLYRAVAAGRDDPMYDLDQDGSVGAADVDSLVQEVLKTRAGDANLDGQIDFADFLQLSLHFGTSQRSWEHGDFDGSGSVDFIDFLILSTEFGFDANSEELI